jgi:hypothetical protein
LNVSRSILVAIAIVDAPKLVFLEGYCQMHSVGPPAASSGSPRGRVVDAVP